MSEWRVGQYVTKGDGAVRIESIREWDDGVPGQACGVAYVQIRYDGSVTHGGSSSSWDGRVFAPLTDAELILAAGVYECDRQIAEAEGRIAKLKADRVARQEAIYALREARAASGIALHGPVRPTVGV